MESLLFLSWSYSFQAGRPAAGAAVADRLIGIDPLNAANLLARGGHFWAEANFGQALEVFDEMRRREPSLGPLINWFWPQLLARLGRTLQVCDAADKITAEGSLHASAQLARILKHAVQGERDRVLELVSGDFELYCWNDPECPEFVAGQFALLGEKERAIQWLEHWVSRGSINYPMLAYGDPLLQSVRGEPRFKRLLDRIRPEWERFVPRL